MHREMKWYLLISIAKSDNANGKFFKPFNSHYNWDIQFRLFAIEWFFLSQLFGISRICLHNVPPIELAYLFMPALFLLLRLSYIYIIIFHVKTAQLPLPPRHIHEYVLCIPLNVQYAIITLSFLLIAESQCSIKIEVCKRIWFDWN